MTNNNTHTPQIKQTLKPKSQLDDSTLATQ